MGGPFPPSGPPPRYYGRRRGGFVWPVLLIVVGLVFLLQNFGLVSWDIWGSLWRLWPLALVLIGLELFLGGGGRGFAGFLAASAVVVIIAAVLIAGTFNGPGTPISTGPISTRVVSQRLQGATSASVSVHFGAGTLNIGPLVDQAGDLARLTYEGTDQTKPSSNYRVRNGQGQLTYSLSGAPHRNPFSGGAGAGGQVELLLSPETPLLLDVQEGAADGKLDLSKLHVSNLTLQTGASHPTITMPQDAGLTTATIKGGAAQIDIEIPDGVAAQIRYGGGLTTLKVDESRFPSTGQGQQMYRSPDYDSAQNKVDLTIEAGVSSITVR